MKIEQPSHPPPSSNQTCQPRSQSNNTNRNGTSKPRKFSRSSSLTNLNDNDNGNDKGKDEGKDEDNDEDNDNETKPGKPSKVTLTPTQLPPFTTSHSNSNTNAHLYSHSHAPTPTSQSQEQHPQKAITSSSSSSSSSSSFSPLKIGDLILLRNARDTGSNKGNVNVNVGGTNGLLHATGLLNTDLTYAVDPDYVGGAGWAGCVFMVCIQFQYSALRELEDFGDGDFDRGDNDVVGGGSGSGGGIGRKSSRFSEDNRNASDHRRPSSTSNNNNTNTNTKQSTPRTTASNSNKQKSKTEAKKHLLALHHGRSNETTLNKTYQTSRTGTPLRYGDVIQLKHYRSSSYVTADTTRTAQVERENLCVTLNGEGSSLSWLKVCPRFKIDREGDGVRNMAEVYLRVAERSNEFLNCSERNVVAASASSSCYSSSSSSSSSSMGQFKEINCSLEKTAWKIMLFDSIPAQSQSQSQSQAQSLSNTGKSGSGSGSGSRSNDNDNGNGKELIRSHNIVMLVDPEARSYLRLPPPSTNTLGESSNSNSSNMSSSVKKSKKAPKSASSHPNFTPSKSNFQPSSAYMESYTCPSQIDSNAYWLLESLPSHSGGLITYTSSSPSSSSDNDAHKYTNVNAHKLRIRHVNTGQYLSTGAVSKWRKTVKLVGLLQGGTPAAAASASASASIGGYGMEGGSDGGSNGNNHGHKNGAYTYPNTNSNSNSNSNASNSINFVGGAEAEAGTGAGTGYTFKSSITPHDRNTVYSFQSAGNGGGGGGGGSKNSNGSASASGTGDDNNVADGGAVFVEAWYLKRYLNRGVRVSVRNGSSSISWNGTDDYNRDHSHLDHTRTQTGTSINETPSTTETFPVHATPKMSEALPLQVLKVNQLLIRDTLVGVDAFPVLLKFRDDILHGDVQAVRDAVMGISGGGGGGGNVGRVIACYTNFVLCRGLDEPLSFSGRDMEHLQMQESGHANASSSSFSSSSSSVSDVKETMKIRQKLASEQNILECAIRILAAITHVKVEAKAKATAKSTSSSSSSSADMSKLIHNLSSPLLWLIYCTMHANTPNQMHVANNLSTILEHVSSSSLATKCILELLGSNMKLQQEKVGVGEIGIFVDMIQGAWMNSSYVNLLRATCNCNGRGVDGNQVSVVNLFLKARKDLQLSFNFDHSNRKVCTWKAFGVYRAGEISKGHALKVNGTPSITITWSSSPSSLSNFNVNDNDTRNTDDFSPMLLYGKPEVPLSEVVGVLGDGKLIAFIKAVGGNAADCIDAGMYGSGSSNGIGIGGSSGNGINVSSQRTRQESLIIKQQSKSRNYTSLSLSSRLKPTTLPRPLSINGITTSSRQNGIFQSLPDVTLLQLRRVMVAEFFVAQIYLYAEAAMDRNYIAIKHLKDLLPFDVLLSVIRDGSSGSSSGRSGSSNAIPDEFKAACCRLLNCLYLDAYPQCVIRLPSLTRIWSRIDNSADSNADSNADNTGPDTGGVSGSGCGSATLPLPDEKESVNEYAYLQECIQEHLEDLISNTSNTTSSNTTGITSTSSSNSNMGGVEWNTFTKSIMESLMLLVKFRFYTEPEQLIKIGRPLLMALDRRNVKGRTNTNTSTSTSRSTVSVSASGDNSTFTRLSSGLRRASFKGEVKVSPENSNTNTTTIKKARPTPWQLYTLRKLSGVKAMLIVLSLVFLSLGVALYQTVSNSDNVLFEVFEYSMFLIFLTELLLRMYCHTFVKTGRVGFLTRSFFTDKFHNLDVCVVLLDVAIILIQILGENILPGNTSSFTKGLRSLRVLKLFRVLRAARLVARITYTRKKSYTRWVLSRRYGGTSEDTLETMVEMVRALSEITRLYEDLTLSTIMCQFKAWHKGQCKMTPSEIFEGVIANASSSSSDFDLDNTGDLDMIFLDLCHYSNQVLVTNALRVLMVNHSSRQILLRNMQDVQLLNCVQQETLYDDLVRKLHKLDMRAEQSELWLPFITEEDNDTCLEVLLILTDLTECCKVKRETLEFDGAEAAERSVQDTLRNMGAFEVVVKVLMLAGELRDGKVEDYDEDPDDEEEDESEEDDDDDDEDTEKKQAQAAATAARISNRRRSIQTRRSLMKFDTKLFVHKSKYEKIHSILLTCNVFLTWFVRDNERNQLLAFQNIELLQSTIDEGIDSTRVIAQIFRKNRTLMKKFPQHLIGLFAAKIKEKGRNPDYLDLIESIVAFGDFNVMAHQYTILKEFTSAGRAPAILYLCEDSTSLEYAERERMCAIRSGRHYNTGLEVEGGNYAPAGELAPLLAFHCKLLNCLAGCAVGRVNITTIEAKLQSLYPYDAVLFALTDAKIHIDVKIPLLNLFFEAYIDVEITIAKLSESRNLWKVIKTFTKPALQMAKALTGGEVSLVDMRKLMMFVLLSTKMVDGFLEIYYSGREFRDGYVDGYVGENSEARATIHEGDEEYSEVEGGSERHWIDQIFVDLYAAYKALYELKSPLLSEQHNIALYRVLDTLTMTVDVLVNADLPLHVESILQGDDNVNDNDEVGGGADGSNHRRDEVSSFARFVNSITHDADLEVIIKSDRTDRIVAVIDRLPRIADDLQADVRYEVLIRKLVSHTKSLITTEGGKQVIPLECVDTVVWTIQLFRAMIETKWTESFQARHKRGKITGKMGIDERDDHGGEEEDEAASPVQDILDESGATTLCLDVIADGMDEIVVEEGVNLLVALLFREGGNKKVQATIYAHLNARGTSPFFEELRNRLQVMMMWHQTNQEAVEVEKKEKLRHIQTLSVSVNGNLHELDLNEGDIVKARRQRKLMPGKKKQWSEDYFDAEVLGVSKDGTEIWVKYEGDGYEEKHLPPEFAKLIEDDIDIPDGFILVRAIQLMSEGHFAVNQDIVREQPNNAASFNLLDDFVNYLGVLSKIPCKSSSHAAIGVASTILEVIQGPCLSNQKHLALSTELIEILNRMMRSKGGGDADLEMEEELKKTGLEIFEALVEGQGKGSEIYERILSVIHMDVLQVMACAGATPEGDEVADSDDEFLDSDDDDNDEQRELDDGFKREVEEVEEEGMGDVQTEALVLMQMLCDYRPALRKQIQYPPEIEAIIGRDVVSVEVIWNGVLQRRFFPIPTMCHNLSDASKTKFVQEVDRASSESKLAGLMSEARILHLEIKHQSQLRDQGVDGIFSRNNQEMATWFSFFFACIINAMLLYGYKWNEPPGLYDAVQGEFGEFSLATDTSSWLAETGFVRPKEATLSQTMQVLVTMVNVLQCSTSVFVLLLFIVVRCPVRYQVGRTLLKYSRARAFFYTIRDPMTIYYMLYVIVASLCLSNQALCCILLLDIIVKDSTTRDVMNAVIYPIKQLSMTVVLVMFVINIFQTILFHYYHDEFEKGGNGGSSFDNCDTMLNCFVITLNYGLRSSGGIGDTMSHTIGNRFIIDLAYFVIVLVILLNVVFGIIIDTFSELRQNKSAKKADIFNKCFICGHEKATFDRAYDSPRGFYKHVKEDHHMWNYIFFLVFIWEQDKDDDDGLELYVRNMAENGDVSWFPMNRALCLVVDDSKSKGGEESLLEQVNQLGTRFEDVLTYQNNVVLKVNEKAFGAFEKRITSVSKRVEQTFAEVKAVKEGQQTALSMSMSRTASPPFGRGVGVAQQQQQQHQPENCGGNDFTKVPFMPVNVLQNDAINNNNNIFDIDDDQSLASLSSLEKTSRNINLLQFPISASSSPSIKVRIHSAHALSPAHLMGNSDPFVVAQVFWNGLKVGESDTIWMTAEPTWEDAGTNSSFTLPLWNSDVHNVKYGNLKVQVFHAHRRGLGNFLGEVLFDWLKLSDVKELEGGVRSYNLEKIEGATRESQRMVQGEVRLSIEFID